MNKFIKKNYSLIRLVIYILMIPLLLVIAYNALHFPSKKLHFFLEDANSSTVLKKLDSYGYHTNALDEAILQWMPKLKSGWYDIDSRGMGRLDVLYQLHSAHTASMNIVVFAGETSSEVIKRLANDMKLNPIDLYKFYHKRAKYKEANIFAGRYALPRNADENKTINYIFNHSDKIFKKFEEDICREKLLYLDMKTLLTFASIIQKESNYVKEMPLISSVIYNRIMKSMRLQMDSTLNYDDYSHVIVTPERIKKDKSLYNTYKKKGIPPHPLATISTDALDAACNPATTEYLFFVVDRNGSHTFAKSYKEHLVNTRKFKQMLKKEKEEKKKESKLKLKQEKEKKKNIKKKIELKTKIKNNKINDSNISKVFE